MVKSAIQALEILSSIPANDGDVAAFGLAAVVEECSKGTTWLDYLNILVK